MAAWARDESCLRGEADGAQHAIEVRVVGGLGARIGFRGGRGRLGRHRRRAARRLNIPERERGRKKREEREWERHVRRVSGALFALWRRGDLRGAGADHEKTAVLRGDLAEREASATRNGDMRRPILLTRVGGRADRLWPQHAPSMDASTREPAKHARGVVA